MLPCTPIGLTQVSNTCGAMVGCLADPAPLRFGDPIGTTAIVLETRQRERVNGIIESVSAESLTIAVHTSFSSCPKFIQGIYCCKFCTLALLFRLFLLNAINFFAKGQGFFNNQSVQIDCFVCPWHLLRTLAVAARKLELLAEDLATVGEKRAVHRGGHEVGPEERDLIERYCQQVLPGLLYLYQFTNL